MCIERMFRNFRLGTTHVNIAVMIPSSESTDVIDFQFLNRRLALVSQINTFQCTFPLRRVDTCNNLYGCYYCRLHGLTRLTHLGPETGTLKFAQKTAKKSRTLMSYTKKTIFLCGSVSANFCARRSAMVNLSLKKQF